LLLIVLLSLAMIVLAVLELGWRGWHTPSAKSLVIAGADAAPSPELIAQGAYLARAGNCMGCHSAPGGAPGGGGVGVATPFGTVYSTNLTPDADTGLGRWSEADFWRALHHGRAKDGRLLYPAFPYPNYTLVKREDAQALWAYFGSLPAARQERRAPALGWPYGSQWALAIWRGVYFRAGEFQPRPAQSAEWNRGAYLVQGLGHCGACHDGRNPLGGPRIGAAFSGQMMPGTPWYAPSLHRADEAGVQAWNDAEVLALLRQGQSPRGRVNGPMAEVVQHGTQYLNPDDLGAIATWLRQLPLDTTPRAPEAPRGALPAELLSAGRKLYEQHCAECHGDQGQGAAGIYPPLAGNRMVKMASPANLTRMVLEGGFGPTTAAHPRPFGMPPFGPLLGDDDLAALLTYLRSAWGHDAAPVDSVAVNRLRGSRSQQR
ncbi:MAG TPA: cytochrome c, partial [Ideonella sp.]|nr:cytochrome c [Ideonella sp.]